MNNLLNGRKYFFAMPLFCWFGLMLVLGAAISNAKAQERVFNDLNFAITIPPTWVEDTNLPKTQNVVFLRKSPDSKRMIIVRVDPNPPYKGPINQPFIAGMERSLEQNGDKLVSSNFLEISGIPAYERTGIRTARGKQVSTFLLGVIADGKSYSIQGMHNGAGLAEGDEIKQILSSFRFLVTPKVQASSTASQSPAYNAGYKFGYFVGHNFVYIICVGFAIVGIIVFLIGRKASNPRAKDKKSKNR